MKVLQGHQRTPWVVQWHNSYCILFPPVLKALLNKYTNSDFGHNVSLVINSLNNTNQSSMFQCFVFSISPQTYSSVKNIKIFAKMKLKICFSI